MPPDTMLDSWFDLAPFFANRSTPAERVVLAWVVILAAVGIGVVCLYLGFTAPPAKAGAAATLRLCGYGFLAFAAAAWALYRLIAWLLDR